MKNFYLLLALSLVSLSGFAQEEKPYCHIANIELLGSGGRDYRIDSDSHKQKFCGDYDNEQDCVTRYKHKNGSSMCSWSAKRVVVAGKKVKLPDLCVKINSLQINVSKDRDSQCKSESPWIAAVDREDFNPPNSDGTCPAGLVPWWESRVPNNISGVSEEYKAKWSLDNHGEVLKVDKACYSSKEEAVAAVKKGFDDPSVFKSLKINDSSSISELPSATPEEPKNEKIENSDNNDDNGN
ncbi:MAG: hypothetical protein ACXVAX_11775 [Pseudobdellovibrio sp.]